MQIALIRGPSACTCASVVTAVSCLEALETYREVSQLSQAHLIRAVLTRQILSRPT